MTKTELLEQLVRLFELADTYGFTNFDHINLGKLPEIQVDPAQFDDSSIMKEERLLNVKGGASLFVFSDNDNTRTLTISTIRRTQS